MTRQSNRVKAGLWFARGATLMAMAFVWYTTLPNFLESPDRVAKNTGVVVLVMMTLFALTATFAYQSHQPAAPASDQQREQSTSS